MITINHCERGGKLYAGGDRAEIIWTPADLKKLFAVASPEVAAAVVLAVWTGQRQGDVLRLPWSAYDGKTIRLRQSKSIRKGQTATAKTVIIPVGETLRRFLDRLPNIHELILVNSRGRPWTSNGFRGSFFSARDLAEVGNLHFHDLRGTAVTRLALSGCTVPEIAAITGHSLADVELILEKHYMGGRIELAESAILKLENRFGENENAEETGKRLENTYSREEQVEGEI